MPAKESHQSNQQWRDNVMSMLSATKTEVELAHTSIKSIEAVVLGDEQKGIIGLAEKFRILDKENKVSDKKRAAVFAIVGWAAAFFGQYILHEILPEKPIPVSLEKKSDSNQGRE